MKIKICGNRDVENLKMVLQYSPDMVGFIFYPSSPRNVLAEAKVFEVDTGDIQRVGVFVNCNNEQILSLVKQCSLHAVQLHGNYPKRTASTLKAAIPSLGVIQVIHVACKKDIEEAADIADEVDLILFDTPGPHHGGHGQCFDWNLLDAYLGQKPFMIAGGIGVDNIEFLPKHPKFYGLDINSSIEDSPGLKNEIKLAELFKLISTFNGIAPS